MTRQSIALIALTLASSLACEKPKGSSAPAKYSDLPFPPASPTEAPDPSVMGPYPVGVMTYEGIFDQTADSVVTTPDLPQTRLDQYGQPRHLVTEVWYPAVEGARGRPGKQYNVVDLMVDQQKALIQQAGVTVPLLQTAAVENAQPRLDDAPYPLIIFSHGQYGIRWQTTFYCVALASHGYIVVSPDHPGDTLQDELQLMQTSSGSLGDSILLNYLQRQADVQYLITLFSDLPASDLLAGMPDRTNVGVTGHSFGALTSLRLGEFDKRVKAIVPMAPTSLGLAIPDAPNFGPNFVMHVPTIIEGSGLDMTLPFAQNALPAYQQMGGTRGLLELTDGGHFSFSDLCKFNLDQAAAAIQFIDVSNVINDGCGPNNTPAAIAEPIINNYAIGFFNWQLRGSLITQQKFLVQSKADSVSPGAATFQSVF